MPEYFFILVALGISAFLLQYLYHLKLYHSMGHMVRTNIVFLLIAIVWDHFAIARGHWFFGQQYLLGPRIGLMPIEEYVFVLVVPYMILVLFRLFEKLTR